MTTRKDTWDSRTRARFDAARTEDRQRLTRLVGRLRNAKNQYDRGRLALAIQDIRVQLHEARDWANFPV